MKQFGVADIDLQRLALDLLKDEEATALLTRAKPQKSIFSPQWKTITIPEAAAIHDAEQTRRVMDALQMLKDRKLTNWKDWQYSSKWIYRSRIILPYRYKSEIVGFSARLIGAPSKVVPKYLLQKPDNFVFNLDRQTANKQFVILHEGDFDAIGTDGVALGSNSASVEQCSILEQLDKRIILLPDADSAGAKLVKTAIREDWSVSFPEWLEYFKDANEAIQEYGRGFVLNSIVHAAINNPVKIKVLAKKYCR